MVSLRTTVKYPKSLLGVIGVLVLLSVGIYLLVKDGRPKSDPNHQTVRLIVFARHGEREPLMAIPGREPFVLGELTDYGRESMEFLGEQLKEEYGTFVERAARTLVSYTSDSRCQETALAIARGMSLENFEDNPLPKLVLEDPDDLTKAAPEGLDLIAHFRQTLPPCVQGVANAAFEYLKTSLNKEQLPEIVQFLIGFLIADSVDTIRMQGETLPLNLTYAMDCLPKTVPLVDERIFAGISHTCIRSFCKPVIENLLNELESVRNGAADEVLSIYGVSDVHVQGIMIALKPEDTPVRPLFGAHLILEVSQSRVIINYGKEPRVQREHFKTVKLSQILGILHSLVNTQMDV